MKLEIGRLFFRAAVGILLVWQILRARRSKRRAEEALADAADSEARFRAFMHNTPAITFIKDEAGRAIYLSPRFAEVLQRPVESCLGKDDFALWPPEIAAEIRRNDLKILADNCSMEVVESIPRADGALTKWLSVKFPFSKRNQRFIGGVAIDITDREHEEEALRESEERFRAAFAHASIGMALTDMTNRYLQVNPALCAITGYSSQELLKMDSFSITHPEDRHATTAMQAERLKGGSGDVRFEKRYLRKDGNTVWVRDSTAVIRNGSGEPIHFLKLIEDITREKEAEELARISEERWQLALEGTNDGIWDWDARNNTVYYSARWKEMLGYQQWELPNRPEIWEQLVHPEDLAQAKAAVQQHLERHTPYYDMEYRIHCKDGTWKWVLARGKAIWGTDGSPLRMIGAHADITERKRAEAQLLYQANHDSLTGLLSRGFFLSHVEKQLAASRLSGDSVTLCLCDVDRFKSINDNYGHPAGDKVLVTLARVLSEGIGDTDLAGRMGGDEFCVLFITTGPARAQECMERVRNSFEATSFRAESTDVFAVTASFGIAGLTAAMSSCDLVEAADRALYAAKEKGRNVVSLLDETQQDCRTLMQVLERQASEHDLSIAS